MENQLELASSFESFTIGAAEAAEILGVNRTRLSQLTTKGVFAYERRKIENHNRLFYRLNDLLNYQRESTYGNVNARVFPREKIIYEIQAEQNNTNDNNDKLKIGKIETQNLEKPFSPKLSTTHSNPPQKFKTRAYDVFEKENTKQRLNFLEEQIEHVKNMILRQEEFLEKIEMHLKSQDLKINRANTKQQQKNFKATQNPVEDKKMTEPRKLKKIKIRSKRQYHGFKK